ncbi:MAG: hypothetical protein ABSA16_12815 [Thermoguttaceae bacterium]|jgi:hypothetical protein
MNGLQGPEVCCIPESKRSLWPQPNRDRPTDHADQRFASVPDGARWCPSLLYILNKLMYLMRAKCAQISTNLNPEP